MYYVWSYILHTYVCTYVYMYVCSIVRPDEMHPKVLRELAVGVSKLLPTVFEN